MAQKTTAHDRILARMKTNHTEETEEEKNLQSSPSSSISEEDKVVQRILNYGKARDEGYANDKATSSLSRGETQRGDGSQTTDLRPGETRRGNKPEASLLEKIQYVQARGADAFASANENLNILGEAIAAGINSGIESAKNRDTLDVVLSSAAKGAANSLDKSAEENVNERARQAIDGKYAHVVNSKGASVAADLVSSVNQMIPAVMLPGAAGTALLAATNFPESYVSARNNGADQKQAAAYGAVNAAINSVGEQLIGGIASKGTGLAGKAANAISRGASSRLAANAMNSIAKSPLAKTALSAVAKSAGEGAEEVVQSLLSTAAERATYNPEAKVDAKKLAYEGLLGGLMGGAFQAASLPATYQAYRSDYDTVNNFSLAGEAVANESDVEIIRNVGESIVKGADEILSDNSLDADQKQRAQYIKSGVEAVMKKLDESSADIIMGNQQKYAALEKLISSDRSNVVENLAVLVRDVSGATSGNKDAINKTVDFVRGEIQNANNILATSSDPNVRQEAAVNLQNYKDVDRTLRTFRKQINKALADLPAQSNAEMQTPAQTEPKAQVQTEAAAETASAPETTKPRQTVTKSVLKGYGIDTEVPASKFPEYLLNQLQTGKITQEEADALDAEYESKYPKKAAETKLNAATAAYQKGEISEEQYDAQYSQYETELKDIDSRMSSETFPVRLRPVYEEVVQPVSEAETQTEQTVDDSTNAADTTSVNAGEGSAPVRENVADIAGDEAQTAEEVAERLAEEGYSFRDIRDQINAYRAENTAESNAEAARLEEADRILVKKNRANVQKVANAYAPILKRFGINGVVVEDMPVGRNAAFDRKTNTIHLSSRISDSGAVGRFIVHEFTHRGTKIDMSLADSIVSAMESRKGGRGYISEAVIRNAYADQLSGLSAEEADSIVREERAAHFMERIMEDVNVLDEFRDDRTFLRKILDAIRDFFARNNPDKQEQIRLRNIEKKINDLLKAANVDEQVKAAGGVTRQADKGVRFSLDTPVEEAGELIAVHNLSEEKLKKVFELGGFPMPSVAIVRAQDGHEGYGEVSVVFGKEVIDPKGSKSNKVYSADAWTPTYPTVEYKANEDAEQRIIQKYNDLRSRFGDDARPLRRYTGDLSDELTRNSGVEGIIEHLQNDTDMMQLYLLDNGKDKVKPVEKETETVMSEDEQAMYQGFIDQIGEDAVRAVKAPDGEKPIEYRRKYISDHLEEIKNAYKGMLMEVFEYTSAEADSELETRKNGDYAPFMVRAEKFLRNGPKTVKTETDYAASKQAILDAVDLDGYTEWLEGLFKGAVEKTGLRNKQETFTASGKRRSWDALHYENTLENVVKAMKDSGEKGLGVFGNGNIFGAATREYKSVEDIKKDASKRLRKVSQEEYADMKQEFQDRLFKIAKRLAKNSDYRAMDDAMDILVEAVSKNKTPAKIDAYIKSESEGYANYSPEITADLLALVEDIRSMPTAYFEAKPQRAVGVSEIGAFVVPSDIKDSTRKLLDSTSAQVVEYERGDTESRLNALNSLNDLRFSRELEIGNHYDYSKSFGVTQTQQFKRWFGDWENDPANASKVVNADGTPKVMYHGTSRGGFNMFNTYGSNYGLFGVGSYFTDNYDVAEGYTHKGRGNSPKIYPVYLNIRNPLDMDAPADMGLWLGQAEYAVDGGILLDLSDPEGTVVERNDLVKALQKCRTGEECYRALEQYCADEEMYKEDAQEFIIDFITDMGYDGITHIGGGRFNKADTTRHRVYIAFDPTQIKSATDNIGTFDPDNSDIRYSRDIETPEQKHIRRLEEQNEYLKKQYQSQTTFGWAKTVSPAQRKQFAGTIAADIPGVSADEVSAAIKPVYDLFEKPKRGAKDTPEVRLAEARRLAQEAAERLVDGAIETEINPMYEQYNDLRNFLRTTPIKRTISAEEFGGAEAYSKWRDGNRGLLRVSTNPDARGIDSVYKEISAQYPEFFPEDITDMAEMLRRMGDVAVLLKTEAGNKTVKVNPLEDVRDSFVQDVSNRILYGFDQLAKITPAAKYEYGGKVNERDVQRAYAEGMSSAAAREAQAYDSGLKEGRKQNDLEVQAAHQREDIQYQIFQRDFNQAVNNFNREIERQNKRVETLQKRIETRGQREQLAMAKKVVYGRLNRLNTMLTKPNRSKHIPQNLRAPVARLLEAVGTTYLPNGKTVQSGAMQDIQEKEYARFESESVRVVDEIATIIGANKTSENNAVSQQYLDKLTENVLRLKEMHAEMNPNSPDDVVLPPDLMSTKKIEYVKQLNRILAMAENYIKDSNTVFLAGKATSAKDFSERMISDLRGKTVPNESNRLRKFFHDVGYEFVSADLFFEMVGESGNDIMRQYRKAQTTQAKCEEEYAQYIFGKTGGKYSTNKAGFNGDLIDISANGKKLKVTRAQLMQLYMTWKRPAGRRHLRTGGAIFVNEAGVELKENTILINNATYDELISHLSDEDKRIADALGSFMVRRCAEWGNDASMQMYGYRMFEDPHYFPMDVSNNVLPANWDSMDEFYRLENAGMTKSIKENASAPLRMTDIFDVADFHVRTMAAYAAYAPVSNDMQRILNMPGVNEAVNVGMGKKGAKYLETLVKTIASNKVRTGDMSDAARPLQFFMNAYKRQAVSFNISTALKQPLSIVRALNDIDAKYILKVPASMMGKEYARAYNTMIENSGVAKMKMLGYSDTGFGKSLRQIYDTGYINESGIIRGSAAGTKAGRIAVKTYDKITDAGMWAAGKMDEATWVRLWRACELEVSDRHKGLSAKEKTAKVAERFNEIIGRSQVVDTVLDTSPLMRNNAMAILTPFMNEPTKALATIITAADASRDGKAGSKKKLVKAIGLVALNNLLLEPIVSALMTMWRDEEDDTENIADFSKKFLKLYAGVDLDGDTSVASVMTSNAVSGVLGSVPILQIFYNTFSDSMQNYSNEKIDTAALSNLIRDTKNLIVNSRKEAVDRVETNYKLFSDFLGSAAAAIGIPLPTLRRQASAMVRTALEHTDSYDLQWRYAKILYNLENSSARTQKQFYNILAAAYKANDVADYQYMLNDLKNTQTGKNTIGIPWNKMKKYIEDRGGKYEIGSDLWLVGVQAEFNLSSFNPAMKVESMLGKIYKSAISEGVKNPERALPSTPALYSYNKADEDGNDVLDENGDPVKVEMTLAEYEDFIADVGKLSYNILLALQGQGQFKNLSAEEQVYCLDKAYDFAARYYRSKFNPDYDLSSGGKWMAEVAKGNLDTTKISRAILNAERNRK